MVPERISVDRFKETQSRVLWYEFPPGVQYTVDELVAVDPVEP